MSLKSVIRSPRWVGFAVGLFAFGVYLKTLAPSVTFIDSGELATVACTLGIAHPTGYPLFTLLGWVFSQLPIAAEPVLRLNMMAAVFCAAGVFVFFQLLHLLLNVVARAHEIPSLVAAAAASLLLAFSETYWSQATSVEVYSLHVLFLSLVLYCFVMASFHHEVLRTMRREGQVLTETKWWMLFAFVLGLSFTNHMTTILLAPGLLYLYFALQGGSKESWRRILTMVPPFLIGFSVYLYLPIRAAGGILLNWGNPVTLERFLWHLSGKQFRVWIFSSTEAAGRQFKYFINTLPHEFAYVGLILAIIGVIALFRLHRKLAIAIVLLFVTCVLYSINYDIHDIDSYFLLAYFCVAIWSGVGFLRLYEWVQHSSTIQPGVGGALIVAMSLAPVGVHYKMNDESSNNLVEDYTKNMFASLKPDALIISYQWDYWVSAAYYFQIVESYRDDVAVVDKELLRRSWYLLQLERRYPWLIQHSRPQVEAYSKELYKFEHDTPYDPSVIQSRYVEMILSFISANIGSRPVYVTSEIEPEFTTGFQRVPEGLAFRLAADTLFHGSDLPHYEIRPFGRRGRLEDMVKNLYVSSLKNRAVYYYQHGFPDEYQKVSGEAEEVLGKLGPRASP